MKKPGIVLKSFMNAAGVFIYVSAVAWLGFNSQTLFGKSNNFLGPLFALLLFIVSALVTGLLVLGKPVLLYLDGSKKEAFAMLFITLAWLVLFLIIIILALLPH